MGPLSITGRLRVIHFSQRLGAAGALLFALFGALFVLALLLTAQSFAQQGPSRFDHFKTGFPLTGGHMTVECESCHINGRLQGTPRTCAACHIGTLAPGMAANHIPVGAVSCDTCHRNSITFAQTLMNHAGINSGCTACHNGQAFIGVTPVSKPSGHVATSADCVSCHTSFVSFAGAAFNHSGITSGCASCHTGVGGVTGKPANHMPTSQDCSLCHKSTVAFGPNTPMNHTGISSGCTACHNGQAFFGVTPVSKPSGHVATSADCVSCHTSFVSFAGAAFNHTGVVAGTCNTCHTGAGGGMVEASRHVLTGSVSCDTCHKSTAVGGFAIFTMGNSGHAALGISLATSNCMTCHAGTYLGVVTFRPHPGQHGTNATSANFCGTCHKSFTSDPGN
jgi:hypothetical protein